MLLIRESYILKLSSGTNLALDALCAVMLRRHDMPFPDTHLVGFYGVLMKGSQVGMDWRFPEHQLAAVATISVRNISDAHSATSWC